MADQQHFFLGALVFFAIGTAATDSEEDDNLFDFYNDLVTDLGPFLALFGESMTKQYLSESISLIDYFIFAMGPIGIITTLVSVIRLCGYTSLKAFIGRSQEGSATVEAELITSTSRDVCELYNHGGISRLVGQPRILELIYIPPSERSLSESSYSERSSSEMSSSESSSSESSSSDILYSQMSDAGDFKEELQLFRYYLNNKESDSTHWTEERGSYLSSWLKSIWSWWLFKNVRQIYEKQGSGDVETAQMDDQGNLMEQQKTHGANTKRLIPASLNPPNLSLNIGITQPSPWVTYSVAALGLILQGGVVALAATDAWLLGWSFDGNSTVSKDAPFLYLIGTVVMCCGLMACAALIGQTTQETRYNHTLNSQSRLIWLQPKQVIADQSFDPFAFFETNDKAIKAWICSWKVEDKPNSKDFSKARNSKGSDPKQLLKDTITYFWIMIPRGSFEFISFVSTTAVLFGYILQFTGLRRMKPWVSLAQLVITILMSILRGALRMQRLSKEDNKLQDSHDLVVGYELDWLSFEIWRRFKKESSQTQTSGEEVQAGVFKQVNNLWQNLTAKNIRDNSSPKRLSNHDILTNPTSFQELFSIRKRLAHLSGNFSESEKMDENEFQNWDDHYVNVRDKAKRLSAAICAIAESFVDQGQPFQDITLQFDNLIPGESRKNSIKLLLKEPGGLTTHWTMDSAPLEAILGLSMWTIISDQRFGKQFEHETNLSAESLQSERIFTLRRGGSGIEMELWFGPRMLIPTKACVKLPTERTCGLFDLWETLPGRGNHKRYIPIERSRPQTSDNEEESYQIVPKGAIRLFGWTAASEDLEDVTKEMNTTQDTEALSEDTCTKPVVTKDSNVKLFTTRNSILSNCAQELFVALLRGFRSGLLENHLRNSLTTDKAEVVLDEPYFRLKSLAVEGSARAFVNAGLGSYSDALLCILPALRNQLPTNEFGLRCSEALVKARAAEHNYRYDLASAGMDLMVSYYLNGQPPKLDAESINPFLGVLCDILKTFERATTPNSGQLILQVISKMAKCRSADSLRYPEIYDILEDFKTFMQNFSDSAETEKGPEPYDAQPLHEVHEHLLQGERKKAVSALAVVSIRKQFSRWRVTRSTIDIYFKCLVVASQKNLVGVLAIVLNFGVDIGAHPDCIADDGTSHTRLRRLSLQSSGTPLQWCLHMGHQVCSRLLINFGAKLRGDTGSTGIISIVRSPVGMCSLTGIRLLLDIREIHADEYGEVIVTAANEYCGDLSRTIIETLVKAGSESINIRNIRSFDFIKSPEGKRVCYEVLQDHKDLFVRYRRDISVRSLLGF